MHFGSSHFVGPYLRKIADWHTTLILGVHSSGLKRLLLYFFQMCVGGGPTLVSVEVFHVS